MLYVGIDPGESWCGFAALDVTASGDVRVEARTYSVKAHRGYLHMARDIVDLLPHARETVIAVEDFRIRRSGHQAFSAGNTLRFLGALEYGLRDVSMFSFHLIPPNDHGEHETRELFGQVLTSYRRSWPKQRHAAWGHCLSAWRVLGNQLFRHNQPLLLQLHQHRRSHTCDQWLPANAQDGSDHVAPAAVWIKRRAERPTRPAP